jgi:hypothetical protein
MLPMEKTFLIISFLSFLYFKIAFEVVFLVPLNIVAALLLGAMVGFTLKGFEYLHSSGKVVDKTQHTSPWAYFKTWALFSFSNIIVGKLLIFGFSTTINGHLGGILLFKLGRYQTETMSFALLTVLPLTIYWIYQYFFKIRSFYGFLVHIKSIRVSFNKIFLIFIFLVMIIIGFLDLNSLASFFGGVVGYFSDFRNVTIACLIGLCVPYKKTYIFFSLIFIGALITHFIYLSRLGVQLSIDHQLYMLFMKFIILAMGGSLILELKNLFDQFFTSRKEPNS